MAEQDNSTRPADLLNKNLDEGILAIVGSKAQHEISDDYLGLASDIVRDDQFHEGSLRTAIGRAYYSVFLTLRDRLFGADSIALTNSAKRKLRRKLGLMHQPSSGSHEIVISSLALLDKPPVTLQHQIAELQEARVHADYHFTLDNLKDIPYDTWREYSTNMVALASQVLPAAKQLPPFGGI